MKVSFSANVDSKEEGGSKSRVSVLSQSIRNSSSKPAYHCIAQFVRFFVHHCQGMLMFITCCSSSIYSLHDPLQPFPSRALQSFSPLYLLHTDFNQSRLLSVFGSPVHLSSKPKTISTQTYIRNASSTLPSPMAHEEVRHHSSRLALPALPFRPELVHLRVSAMPPPLLPALHHQAMMMFRNHKGKPLQDRDEEHED